MNKRIVSFVNPNFRQGPKEFNAYFLPYSCGVIWSYASSFKNISNEYELGEFIWRRDNIKDVVELLKQHDVVGFSTYIWNRHYNDVLARELKKVNPNILIVVGGPDYPIHKPEFFKKYPHIDICVKLEGEISFKKILEERLKPNPEYDTIPGLLINYKGNVLDTGESERIENLDSIPSPYLTDVFKPLMDKHPEVRWNVTMESNRGCPYGCTFCDWGSLTYNKVKKFDLQRVYDELEWIGQHGCDFVSLTDANFGIFPKRDSMIADKLIEVQKKYNNPKAYTIAWAKNQKREVVEIVRKLIYEGGTKIGLNLSVQTMDDNVLTIIDRNNLEMNDIAEVFRMCEEYGIPMYTELILGLPGETLASWKENFYKLYRVGNHTGITIYQAQLLENAQMNLSQRRLYKIEGRMVYDYISGTYNEHEIKEGVEVVVSTRDLPHDRMVDAQVWSWFQNTFHINGITNYISRFLNKYQGLDYRDFYESLFQYIKTDSWLKQEEERIREHYDNWVKFGRINHIPIQGMEIHGWNLIHSTMINIHSENKLDHVTNVVEKFVRNNFKIEPNLLTDLLALQKAYSIDFNKINEYPRIISFNHDIPGYLQGDSELNIKVVYEFNFPENKDMSLRQFCEQIFFARRRNFGKSWINKHE